MTMFLAPYTAIADIDGSPLDAGFLFFGEYEKDPELFPIEVFWDADFTVPAAQPIRTRNGYPVRNGSPTKVYLKTAQHSIAIKNRNGAFILVDFFNKGWDASFVVDESGKNQQEINNSTVRHVPTVSHMLSLPSKKNGDTVFVKSYNPVNYALAIPYHAKGGGFFVYDSSKSAVNDGGIIINGWVRLNFDVPDAYMFGAYGNWNADNQTGNDDTLSIQALIDFTLLDKDHRRGGKRVMRIPSGNYKHGSLNITAPDQRFSLTVKGDGLLNTILWCDPESTGITLGTEHTRWEGLRFHGKLEATPHSVGDPSIDYIFKCKLPWKYLDIDVNFNECGFSWGRTLARVAGRGFTWDNGVTSQSGMLFEIACDDDLIVAGDTPSIHNVASAMRHFKISGSRFDAVSSIATVSGTHELKDCINGFTLHDCELTLVNRIIQATDCTLISPKFTDNLAIGCFNGGTSTGAVDVPRAVDVLDSNNKWFNYVDAGNTAATQDLGIRYMYRFNDCDGFRMLGSTAKDLVFGFIRIATSGKDININGSNFPGFGDLQTNTALVDNMVVIDGLNISGNTVKAKVSNAKKYVRTAQTGSANTVIDGNDTKGLDFEQQAIPYTPKLRIGSADSSTATYSNVYGGYHLDGDFCVVDVAFTVTETAANGLIGISLPIPAVAKNPNSSAFYAGEGALSTLSGFTLTNHPRFLVEASTSQTAKIMSDFSTQLNLSAKTGNAITIRGEFRYRFK